VASNERNRTPVGSLLGRFLLMALPFTLIPLLVLALVYFTLVSGDLQVRFSQQQFEILLGLTSIAALLGIVRIVHPLVKLKRLSRKLKQFAVHGIDDSQLVEYTDSPSEIATIARCFLMVSSKLKNAEQELEESRLGLRNPKSTLRGALEFTTNFDSQISMILEMVVEILDAEMGVALSFFESEGYHLVSSVAPKGCTPKTVYAAIETKLRPLMSEGRLLVLPAVGESEQDDLFAPPLIYAPIRTKEGIVGAICLSGRRLKRNYAEQEVVHLSDVADWLSAPFDHFKQGMDDQRTFFETLCVMSRVVELRIPYVKGHAERVAAYARRIGELLKLSDEELVILRDAALLHDLGNLAVPTEILAKPDTLDPAEREIIAKHPVAGERMVLSLTRYRPLLDPIRHHHELLDGSGYPDHLKGSAISKVTRILTVANMFDAMTSHREYRPAFEPEVALEMLKKMACEGKIDKESVAALTHAVMKDLKDSARIAS